jgi:hypothetical protein
LGGKGGEIGVLKRRLQRTRARPWSRNGHYSCMHTVVTVGCVAHKMALPKCGKLAAWDHDLPNFSMYASEKHFGNTMDDELSLGDQRNVRGHRLNIGHNMGGKNYDPLPGEF